MNKTRQCTKCNEIKPSTTEFFFKSKARGSLPGALQAWCKRCYYQERKKREEKYKKSNPETPKEKTCVRCLEIKPSAEFGNRIATKDHLNPRCRKCVLETRTRYPEPTVRSNVKECCECKEVKPIEDFRYNRENRDHRSYRCKSCSNKPGRRKKIEYPEPIIQNDIKRCCECKEVKPIEQFNRNKGQRDHHDVRCKQCSRKQTRERHIKKRYGITPTQRQHMFDKQQGKCSICKTEMLLTNHDNKNNRACVDHDNTTGKVRDLLCNSCNSFLAGLENLIKKNLLDAAIAYIHTHQ